jgi:glycosidase
MRECAAVLPDLTERDISGSPFAIAAYEVEPAYGGNAALARLRARLAKVGLKLLLDFIPNHVGFDHHWVRTHPEYFIEGSRADYARDPATWGLCSDTKVRALGRDPNFPGWRDTLQLNYFNPALRIAMIGQLEKVAQQCDGVRCDMAMLIEPEVFRKTWSERAPHAVQGFSSWWPDAISHVRSTLPDFHFIAEVYWGYEHTLQSHGFNYTYDKVLYDRLLSGDGPYARAHLIAPLEYQDKMVRFLENHDEARVASKLNLRQHAAAAAVTFFAPGMSLFHDGQLSGRRMRIPVQLSRAPRERDNPELVQLYKTLLPLIHSPTAKHGARSLLDTRRAWPDNGSSANFICYLLEHPLRTLLVAVNYAEHRGQCFVRIPDRAWLDGSIEFRDLLSHERLVRPAGDLLERGLFLDCDGWQSHIFSVEHT